MERFEIDDKYICEVTVKYGFTSNDEMCSVTSNVDHPSFAGLRDHLEKRGLVATERQWWNGDRVLEDFMLNDKVLKKGDKFLCASAMKYHLENKNRIVD